MYYKWIVGLYWLIISEGLIMMPSHEIITASSQENVKKAVAFDLNGVLVSTSIMRAAAHLGRARVGAYFLLEGKTHRSLKELLYAVLNDFPFGNGLQLCDPYGDVLPAVFCDIFKGECTETECYDNVKNVILSNKHRFSSQREHNLALKAIEMFFNPRILVSLQTTKKATLKILKECQAQGHEVFIISNYGKESFELLRATLPEIFEGMEPDHLIISAHVNAVKPHKDIYDILYERVKARGINPTPSTCFVIDDQLENVHGVNQHSMTGIHFKNAKNLRADLKLHKILK